MAANDVHPTAVIEGDVEMGTGNVVGPYSVLVGPLTLRDDNEIGPHAVIGTHGDEIWQRRHDTTGKRVKIGSRCTIREHVTVHKPVYGDLTLLGDDVYLMHGAYIAHDARLGDGAILAQNTAIGGVSRVLERGYVAIGAVLHQHCVCGHYAIVGAAAAAVKSVRPFTRHVPGRPLTLNAYAIERYDLEAHRDEIERYFRDGIAPQSGRFGAMVAEYDELVAATGRGQY